MLIRGISIICIILIIWQLLVITFHLPSYILPTPWQVLKVGIFNRQLIWEQAIPTIIETFLGLFFAVLLGFSAAMVMNYVRLLSIWFLPILLISQALPTFAIAPLLVVWLGYGMASKIATTVLMLFFPITSAFYDGLRRTNTGWLDLAIIMGASKWKTLCYIRLPAALPAFASGLRVATAMAPMGAVFGEWVGSSSGLGFLMLNANARMQIDLMFAVLFFIVAFTLILYFSIDKLLRVLLNHYFLVKEAS